MYEWPSLPYDKWNDTLDILHLWTQIVGKVKLQLNPFLNQWWEVSFFITPTGLTTGRIPYKHIGFEINFNFLTHQLIALTSTGKKKTINLQSQTVAEFYQQFMQTFKDLDIDVNINTTPSEIQDAIPFEKDTKHRSYEKKFVTQWHQIQLQTSFIFDRFRSNFRGKSSPVQFFWGSFDLNTTRFSGKKLPDKTDWPKGYHFMRYAENEENFACGFWPGDQRFPYPAFYSYLYPAPEGYETIHTGPSFSYYNKTLAQCILPYEEICKSKKPEKDILHFLQTTYHESAKIGKWNMKDLEAIIPE